MFYVFIDIKAIERNDYYIFMEDFGRQLQEAMDELQAFDLTKASLDHFFSMTLTLLDRLCLEVKNLSAEEKMNQLKNVSEAFEKVMQKFIASAGMSDAKILQMAEQNKEASTQKWMLYQDACRQLAHFAQKIVQALQEQPSTPPSKNSPSPPSKSPHYPKKSDWMKG